LAVTGFADGAGDSARSWKTPPQRGQVNFAAPSTAAAVKTCVQTGFGQGNDGGMVGSVALTETKEVVGY
jgi:hypothetical protein